MRLLVDPLDGPTDELPSITVEDAGPAAAVTLRLETTDAAGNPWRSEAKFVADGSGFIDAGVDVPVQAAFEGADPGGLFWSMEFTDEDRAPVIFAPSDDHLEFSLSAVSRAESASTVLTRRWRSPGTGEREVSGEGFAGSLFTPPESSSAGVLVVPGSMGATSMRPFATAIAAQGYHVLLIAYEGEDTLPEGMREIPVEVVGAAARLIRGEAGLSRLGIVSVSVGTQLALSALARGEADADCAVAIAPSAVVWQALPGGGGGAPPRASALSHRGEPVPWLSLHGERVLPEMVKHAVVNRFARHPRPSALHMLAAYEPSLKNPEAVERAEIDVASIACPLMLLAGEEDAMWPAAEMVERMTARRREAGIDGNDVTRVYPGAGHFFRPPHTPTTVPWSDGLVSGGSAEANARAQSEGWAALLGFLRAEPGADGSV